jgi:hypothetical protein
MNDFAMQRPQALAKGGRTESVAVEFKNIYEGIGRLVDELDSVSV